MTDWLSRLTNALELETVDVKLLNNLDDILSWSGLGAKDESYRRLEELHGESLLHQKIEELLDRLIVGDFSAGDMFPVTLSSDHAKKRYRQLMRVFHPDRGAKSQVWLNYRAEKINKAYQSYLDLDVSVDSSVSPVAVKAKSESKQKTHKATGVKFRYRPSVWRERLGSPQELQRKILYVFVILSSLLVLTVFVADKRINLPETEIKSKLLVAEINEADAKLQEHYVFDLRAQQILNEADFLIAEDGLSENEISGVVEKNEDSELSWIEQSGDELEGLLEFVDKKELKDDICVASAIGLSPNEAISLERVVGVRINLRSGPSEVCSLLMTMDIGTVVLADVPNEGEEWTRVVVDGVGVEGWSNAKLLKESYEKQINSKPEIASKLQMRKDSVKNKTSLPFSQHRKKEAVELNRVPEVNVVNELPVYFSVIEKLKLYYEKGDGVAISQLYMSSGRENEIRSSEKIREYYKKAFTKIEDRKFRYSIESYSDKQDSGVVVKGVMNLSFIEKKKGRFPLLSKGKSETVHLNAKFKLVMIRVANDYKIAAFEWIAF